MFPFSRPFAFALSLIAANAASAETLRCDMVLAAGHLGWVPPTIGLNHSPGAAVAQVSDGIILALSGAPIEARVATENASRTTYVWRVTAQDNSGQYAKISYRLTVQKSDLSARLKVLPEGYANSFDAGGRCQPLKS